MLRLCQMLRHRMKYIISVLPGIYIARIREKLEKYPPTPCISVECDWVACGRDL